MGLQPGTGLAGCATDTTGCGKIKVEPTRRDRFAAVFAVSVFIFVHTVQCKAQARDFGLAPLLLCLGHGLILQRVHPAEPSHRLLVECDNGFAILAACQILFQVGQTRQNTILEVSPVAVIHG